MKVLLVEDDKKLALALGIRLRSDGHEITTTPDAISAMSSAIRFAPDVVIIDINLPGGDGFTVAERLLASVDTQSTPFIFMTASKKEGLRKKAMQLGAAGFLEKPFSSTDIAHLINGCR